MFWFTREQEEQQQKNIFKLMPIQNADGCEQKARMLKRISFQCIQNRYFGARLIARGLLAFQQLLSLFSF